MDKIDLILRQSKNVLITSHLQPDPDAICSALGMYDYVLKEYPDLKVDCYMNGEKLEAYSGLKNYDNIKWISELADVVNNYDTLVFTDGSQTSRFTNKVDSIDLTKFKTICIDHHKNEFSKFDAMVLEPDEPSASQLIYKYFFRDSRHLVDSYVAEVLLTGILSDTGMLKFIRSNSLSTFDYVKELIEISDLDLKMIEDKYFSLTASDWDIISELIKNIVKVDNVSKPFLYSYLPIEFLDKYSLNLVKQGKSKFQMLFATSIDKYKWSFVASPSSSTKINLSFRSSPGVVNVRQLAENFGGGGHDLAAGGELSIIENEPFTNVCLKIVDKIKTLI